MLLEALSKSYCTLLHSAAHTQAHKQQLHTNVYAHIQMVGHKERSLDAHMHQQTHTYSKLTNQRMHKHTDKFNGPEASFENLTFFFPYPFFQWNDRGNGKRISAAEVQVIFIFIHQGSSLSLQTAWQENIRWWEGSACYSQLQASQCLRY